MTMEQLRFENRLWFANPEVGEIWEFNGIYNVRENVKIPNRIDAFANAWPHDVLVGMSDLKHYKLKPGDRLMIVPPPSREIWNSAYRPDEKDVFWVLIDGRVGYLASSAFYMLADPQMIYERSYPRKPTTEGDE